MKYCTCDHNIKQDLEDQVEQYTREQLINTCTYLHCECILDSTV